MTKPLAIDLYAGLGGWTEGLLAEGFRVVGFDIERHAYGSAAYPAQLVLQDVLTLDGAQFTDAALIVASPPCQAYSYRAMPWKRAKALPPPDNTLFEACFRIQREACAAAGRFIPLVVENVRGAQPWVGRARWHHGSFYLWGDVPALMPIVRKFAKVPTMGAGWYPPDHPKHVAGLAFNGHAERNLKATKNTGGSGFAVAHNTTSGHGQNPDGRKQPGQCIHGVHWSAECRECGIWRTYPKPDEGVKVRSESGRRTDVGNGVRFTSRDCGIENPDGRKGGNGGWFNDDKRTGKSAETGRLSRSGSQSSARKAASAHIAKIPLPLSRHIARAWHPEGL